MRLLARASARQLRGEELIAELARVVAIEENPPGLRIAGLVAQRGERNPDLERPAVIVDFRRRFPEEIGRRILSRRIVADRVVLDVVRRDDEERGRAAGVAGVDEDAAIVVEAVADIVAIGVRRADAAGRGIVELEAGVEKPVVVGQVADVADRRLGVVAGIGLIPTIDSRGAAPALVAEVAVDRDAAGGTRHADRIAGERGLRRGRRRGERQLKRGERADAMGSAVHRSLRRFPWDEWSPRRVDDYK